MASPCVLRRFKGQIDRADAYDVAMDVVRAVRERGTCLALYVFPDNRVEFVHADCRPARLQELIDRAPLALVGIYGEKARAVDIRDDILAMPREVL
jgi:hypothetical protein